MINMNNMCIFEGRLTKEPKVEVINTGNSDFNKAFITIAVDRGLSKEKKENAAQTTDFINLTAFGSNANLIGKYFKKGSGIKVLASYRSFQKEDSYGNKTFGSSLVVEQIKFPTAPPSENSNNNNSGNAPDDYYGMEDGTDMPF